MKPSKSIIPTAALCGLSLLSSATQVSAQDVNSPAVPPASPPAPGSGVAFSDGELDQYVKAALAIQQIQQDSAVPESDKQAKIAAAVQQAGLTPEKFNQIALASQSDPALQQRIQAVAGKLQEHDAAVNGTPEI
ncbi:hypothetical protein WSK_4058 [Novosphingobium sp. Rr 2-17]|uniref:DUF4168 domain-containing protein n=1 Tax=Novosphingobium sp. Rr 2-17 TaxID=555793 RepID=UPI0002699C25|nr:DUF4168 domain-containing protein [Novosphingobium sp. Rr 2-17]EIZ77375.1 hypothetical protein WSK_4058 [Novosphingobium sp. Rr 2-17]